LLITRHTPSRSTLLPYTTLFRSLDCPPGLSHVPAAGAGGCPDLRVSGHCHVAAAAHRHAVRAHQATAPLASRVITGAPWLKSDSDRKSTRLNSSHVKSSYAVFCL